MTDPPSPEVSAPRLHVLVADDEEPIRDLMRYILDDQGCDVTTVANGREAVERVEAAERGEAQPVDLVFVDILMPVLNGVEAFRRMRAADPTLPVVLVSGFGSELESLVDEAVSHGAMAFIQKPFSVKDILAALDEARTRRDRRH